MAATKPDLSSSTKHILSPSIIPNNLLDLLEKVAVPAQEGPGSKAQAKLKDVLFHYAIHKDQQEREGREAASTGCKATAAGRKDLLEVQSNSVKGLSFSQASTSIGDSAVLGVLPGGFERIPKGPLVLGEDNEDSISNHPSQGSPSKDGCRSGDKGKEALSFKAMTDWRRLFKEQEASSFKLSFKPPVMENGRIFVEPTSEVIQAGSRRWEDAIVGQFLDRKPPFAAVQRAVQSMWAKNGSIQIFTLGNGSFIFKVDDVKVRERILESGIWHVAGRPMVVYKWRPNIEPMKFQLTSLPVWVKLFNVPPEYWTEEGISCVASAIGVPLYVDSATEKGNQMGFMKVCVEVQVEDRMPNSFSLRVGGKEVVVKVEYLWKPSKCSKCKVFGHTTSFCKEKPLRVQQEGEAEEQASGNNKEKAASEELMEGEAQKQVVERPVVDNTRLVENGKNKIVEVPEEEDSIVTKIQAEVGSAHSHRLGDKIIMNVNNTFALLEEKEKEKEGEPPSPPSSKGDPSSQEYESSQESSPEVLRFKGLRRIDEVEEKAKEISASSKRKKNKKKAGDKGNPGTSSANPTCL